MSPALRLTPWACLLLLPALAGCQGLGSMLEGASKPSARVISARLTDLSLQSTTLAFDVELSNPYGVPLPLTNLDYSVGSGGQAVVTGKADVQGTVPAKGSKVLTVPATISFARLLETLKEVRPGAVVPYEANLNLSVDAPTVGVMSLPLKKKGELPIPAVPSIELSEIQWQSLTFDRASAVMRLKVGNTNQFPVDLSKLGFSLSLAGTPVVSTDVQKSIAFKAGEENTIEIPISFAPRDLGFAAFNVLRGKGSGYRLSGLIGLNSAFGAFELPYEKTGQTMFR